MEKQPPGPGTGDRPSASVCLSQVMPARESPLASSHFCIIGLKSAMPGVFTPWESANTRNRGLCFFFESPLFNIHWHTQGLMSTFPSLGQNPPFLTAPVFLLVIHMSTQYSFHATCSVPGTEVGTGEVKVSRTQALPSRNPGAGRT